MAFWQQAYEKSEAEQSKLLDRIYELEMRNEGLLAKVKFGRDAGAMGDMVEVGKRKGSDVTNSGTAKKRTKTQGPTASNGLLDTVGDGLGRVGCLDEGWFQILACDLLTEWFTSYGVVYEAVLYLAEGASEKSQLP